MPPPDINVHRGRVFDRHVQFDERSRAFPIRAVVPKRFRSFTWAVSAYLDQGQEGACVGFGWAHELSARPVVIRNVTNAFAHDHIYKVAQTLDEWPGEAYEGTSVIAGAQAVVKLGGMTQYRWGFGLDDMRLGIGHEGPCVQGLNWYDGMFETDAKGFIHPTGALAGGHCVCTFANNEKDRFFRIRNSWGIDWGVNGSCKISYDDMEKLLHENGEVCFPTGRKMITVPA